MSLTPEPARSREHEALQIAEQRLRRALRAGCIATWEWDLSTNHVEWSDNAEELLGLRSGHTSEFEDKVHPEDQERHRAALKATIDTGTPYDIEIRFVKPDDAVIWVHDKAELQIGPHGQRVLIGIAADITVRKRAEAEALGKATLLEATLDNMDQGLLLIDADHKVALYNRRVTDLLSLPEPLLASRPSFEEVRQYQAQMGEFPYIPDPFMERLLRDSIATGPFSHERVRPNGTALEIRTVPMAGGGAVRTFTDITARKAAETKAVEAAALLQVTLEHMGQGLIMVDADETIQVYNRKALELLDLPEVLMHGPRSYEAVKRYQREQGEFARSDIDQRQWLHTGDFLHQPTQYVRERPNGTVLEVCSVPLAGGGAVRIFTDITARTKAEAEAREKAALLEATLEHMDQGLMMFDATETVRVYNHRVLDLLNLPKDLLARQPNFRDVREYQLGRDEFVHSNDAFRQWVENHGVNAIRDSYERVRPNGTVLEIRTVPLPNGGAVRTFTDITARRQAEAELKESEARYRLLAEHAGDIVIRSDLAGTRLYVSPASRTILGYAPEELMGSGSLSFVHPDDLSDLTKKLIGLRQGHVDAAMSTHRLQHKNGSWRWVEAGFRLVRSSAGEPQEVVAIIRDVTERKQLEEHLRQSQKMEAVGQLTGGIAHDFNNLLTVILGNAEMLADGPTDAALTYGLSRQILAAAERGADLTQKLLAFGRRQSLKPEWLKLSKAVDEMVPLLHRTLGEHIELATDLHESSLAALTDRTLLESAILNLAVNARDAMPRHGTLTIRTGERLARPAEGMLPMGQPVVYVTVSDTGTGIPPEVLPRVFEPFFTTKEVGKGSGLGLSMVYGFAEQTGGHVSIESQEGVGTSVTIVLAGVAPAAPQALQDEKVPTLAAPTARILLVEDQPEVLKFASSLLLSLGYEVEAVSAGPDALELLARDSRFDLLFSDVVLPKGMSGVELAQRAREVKPDLKVVLTSGYSEDIFEHHGRPDKGTPLLRKPYRRKDLAAMLTKVLASEQAFQGAGSEVVAFPGPHERRRA